MWRALHVTGGDIVVFDGDTANPDPNHLRA